MRIKRGWAALRDNRRGGLALIAALCAAAVLLGLAMSLLYSSSLVLARANRKTGQERVYQLAKTFDSTLNYELTRYNTDKDGHKLGASDEKQSPETGGTLYDFVNQFLDRDVYAAYNADNPSGTSYYYTLEGDGDADYGKPRIRLRKEVPSEAATPVDGEFRLDNNQVESLESAQYIRYTVEVCSEVETEDGAYAYSTEYYRKDQYKPNYKWKGDWDTDDKAVPVYWVNNGWYLDRSGQTPKNLSVRQAGVDEDGNIIWETEPGATIYYTYDLTHGVTYKTYVPTASTSESAGGADPSGSGSGSGGEGG